MIKAIICLKPLASMSFPPQDLLEAVLHSLNCKWLLKLSQFWQELPSVPLPVVLQKAKENAALQTARSINLLEFQYSTDNNSTYPTGAKAENIAITLLQNKYANDPSIFAIGSACKYTGTTADFSDFTASNIGWDFTAISTTSGVTSSASDLLPTVYCTGESVTIPTTAGTGLNLTLSGSGVFKNYGIAVAYKGNNASFIKGALSGATAVATGFISKSYNDSTSYTQLKP